MAGVGDALRVENEDRVLEERGGNQGVRRETMYSTRWTRRAAIPGDHVLLRARRCLRAPHSYSALGQSRSLPLLQSRTNHTPSR